jgi:hypothetical protein
MSGMARAGRGQNPFDMGIVQVGLHRPFVNAGGSVLTSRTARTSGDRGTMSTGHRSMMFP